MPGKWRTGDGKRVIALDLDGTLANYHQQFLWFAELYLDKPMPPPDAINPGLPLYRHMHVSKQRYRECKLAFRQGGMKRWMPCYDGAAGLTASIRKAGIEVWIATTRPYLRLENIDPDTREWLRRNRIQYDAVIYGDHKYSDLVRQVGVDRIIAAVDDLPEQIDRAGRAGISRVYIRDQPYSRVYTQGIRFYSLGELWEYLREDISERGKGKPDPLLRR